MVNLKLRRAVRLGLTCGVAASVVWAGAAVAQDQEANEGDLNTVIVTGSRIARPDLTANSPITIVDEEFLKQKGTVNIEEVLNILPQVVPGLGSQVNNGGDGTATVDLYGLGPTRTLVLINGRRFVPATNTGRTDLNAIPTQLVKRIDVLTGGASAVYGSDALAGVVNFVLKDDYQGAELGTRYGESEKSDAQQVDFFVLLGANFADGRGNATIATTGYDRKDLFQDTRAFSAIDLQGNGSATGIAGRIDNAALNPFPAQTVNGVAVPASSNFAFNGDRSIRRFNNTLPETSADGQGDRFNFAPVNYLVTPQTRYTLNGFAHYDVSDNVRAYVETYYISSRSAQNLAPTPATGLVLPLSNPLIAGNAAIQALAASRPDPTAPLIFRRRMSEFGLRFSDESFDTTQVVMGLNGGIGSSAWKYDLYYSFGRTASASGIRGDLSKTKLNASLAGCPPGPGTVPNCRVIDFFGPGKISAADVDFAQIKSAVDTFKFDRSLVQANVFGQFHGLPAGDIGAAFGVEHRKDLSKDIKSDAAQNGDLSGFNAVQSVSGGFDVNELYGELNIPLLADKPGASYLGVAVKGRYSDYSTVGGLTTYTGELEWKPIRQLRFRGSYSKASRAPSVFELFQSGDQSFPTATDPCALIRANGLPQVVSPATQVLCTLSGLPTGTLAAQTNSQIESLNIGSANLKQEDGKSYSVGLVWTPEALGNLSVTLDYHNIKVDGYVARAFGGAASEVAACFSNTGIATQAAYNADAACGLVGRNSSGDLLIRAPLANASQLQTNGYQLAVNYGFGLDKVGLPATAGKMTLRLDLGYVNSYLFDGTEFVGQTSSDFGTLPKLRSNLRIVHDVGAFQTALNWNRIGAVDERPGDGGDTSVSAWDYFDLAGRYTIAEKYTVALTVTNLLDEGAPVILTGFTNTNTDNTTYDLIGRRYGLSFTAKF